MRALLTFLAASTLLVSHAIAAPIATIDSQQPTAQQMNEVQGTYKLSDNRRAELFVMEGQLYLRIGRNMQKQLVLAGPNRLASRDGSIAIRFGPDSNNDRIVLEQDRGSGQPDTIRLAFNERVGRGAVD